MPNTVNWLNESLPLTWSHRHISLLNICHTRTHARTVHAFEPLRIVTIYRWIVSFDFVWFSLVWFGLLIVCLSTCLCECFMFFYCASTSSCIFMNTNNNPFRPLSNRSALHYILNNVTQSEIYKCFVFVEMFMPTSQIFVTTAIALRSSRTVHTIYWLECREFSPIQCVYFLFKSSMVFCSKSLICNILNATDLRSISLGWFFILLFWALKLPCIVDLISMI